MKKILLTVFALACVSATFAQDVPVTTKKKKKDYSNIINRPGDHIMLQLSSDHWSGAPDSVSSRMGGLSRGANAYVMLDKPFKSNPQLSVGFGIGVGTSNIYFKKTFVNIAANTPTLPFTNLDSADHFKKFKLSTAYLEVPVELRFTQDPDNYKRTWKAAIGIKVGTLLNAHTKGKTLENKDDGVVNSFTSKQSSKAYFNSTRLALTARVGWGLFSIFGSYQVNSMFKDGVAADIKPFQIGLNISGL